MGGSSRCSSGDSVPSSTTHLLKPYLRPKPRSLLTGRHRAELARRLCHTMDRRHMQTIWSTLRVRKPKAHCTLCFARDWVLFTIHDFRVLLIANSSRADGNVPGGVLVGRILLPQQLLAAVPPGDHELAVPPAVQRRRCLPLTALHQPASDLRDAGTSSELPMSHLTVRIAQAQSSCTEPQPHVDRQHRRPAFVDLSTNIRQCCTCLGVTLHE